MRAHGEGKGIQSFLKGASVLLALAIAMAMLAAQGLSITEAGDRSPSHIVGLADSGQAFHDDDDDDDDGDEPKRIKIQGLTLKYHDFGLGSPVTVELVKDTKRGELVGSTTVADGGTITVRTKSGEKRVGATTHLRLNGELIKIHTSCSKPIDIGFFYGPDEDDAHEAESLSEFAQTGLNAALEVVALEPPGACGSFVPTATPTPTPTPTSTPTPTPTPTTPTPTPTPTPEVLPPEVAPPAPAPEAALPAALPPTGGDPGVDAGGPGYAAIMLALTGLALMGGGAWALTPLRRREMD